MSGLQPDGLGENKTFGSLNTDQLSHGEFYNVKQFGAVGDNSTDDGPAIQEAIDTINANGGGTLYYPGGDYLIDTPITSKSDVYHRGAGWGKSILHAGTLGNASIFNNDTEGHGNVRYENLEFRGENGWQNVSGYDPDRKFLFHQHHHDLFVTGCKFVDSAATAVGCDFGVRDYYLHNFIKDAGTDGQTQGSNGIGIGVAGGEGFDEEGNSTGKTPTWVHDNYIENTTMHAVTFEAVNVGISDWKIATSNIIRDAHTGISFEDVRDGFSAGNIIRDCSEQGILLDTFPNSVGDTGPDRIISIGDRVINGTAPAQNDIVIGSEATDCHFQRPIYLNGITRNGTNCTVNNIGLNSGDPSSTGSWNGNGRDGIMVYDTANSTKYWYINGSWV